MISIITLMYLMLLQVMQSDVPMADDFRGEGKIYVVISVMLILLIGLFIWIFRLENRLKKLEKEEK